MVMKRVRHGSGIGISNRTHCSAFFFAAGIGIGAWASSLPLLVAKMGLDKGQLGVLLLCFALGAIILMVNVGRFIDQVKTSSLCLGGCLVFGLCISMVPFGEGLIPVGLLIFVAGAGFGTLDVSMNTEASQIERAMARHLMSSFHALFSVGNILGAIFVANVGALGGGLEGCLGGAGIIVVLTAICASLLALGSTISNNVHPPAQTATPNGKPKLSMSQQALVLMLGMVAFLAFLAEGGIMDWTAVYMVNNLAASESIAAYSFAVFTAAMAIGRLCGDAATKRIGHISLLKIGGSVCSASLLIMLVTRNIPITLVALAICGFGVANMIPAVFASAGSVGGRAAGRAMSIVTTMGYTGLLVGPAVLGFVAQISNLTISLGLIVLAFAIISASSFQLARRMTKFRTSDEQLVAQ